MFFTNMGARYGIGGALLAVGAVLLAFCWYWDRKHGGHPATTTASEILSAAPADELRFWVHPAVWGSGERPLRGEAQNRLRLLGSEAFDSGVTLLRYAPVH